MTQAIKDQADQVIAATYKRFPIVIERGQGCTLWDTTGKSYLDFVAGIAVCNLGHAHPRIAQAIADQAQRLCHVSNLYYTIPQIELASLLVEKSFADRVFFSNSGAEANESAIKLARKYFQDQGQNDRFQIIAMEQSFHGRTMAALSATGQAKIKKGFSPVLEGFEFVPFNDVSALEAAITSSTAAVLLEPIQGEGGIRCPMPDYLMRVRRLCDERDILLIFDEVQTGIGRTGKLFAHEHYGVQPDIMTLAKALANGLPIGAMLAREEVARSFGPGSHATTFGGSPLVSTAAVQVLKIIEEEKLLSYCFQTGAYFKEQLLWLQKRHTQIRDVRGEGLLLGMKLNSDVGNLVNLCLTKGFLVNGIQDSILRFVPPLIIGNEEIDALISTLDTIL